MTAKRGPGVTDAMHAKAIAARKARVNAKAADDARIRHLASELGTTEAAVRQAEAERDAAGREARRLADLERARRAVGLPDPRASLRDPRAMVSAADVDAKDAELAEAGQPHGERSIAKALGVSRDAVRYARGKDRPRRGA